MSVLRARGTLRSILAVVAAIAAVALVADRALAGQLALLPFDPSSTVGNEYVGWIGAAQNIARTIYMALIIFDLIALAITTLLFRENLGEFMSSIALKVLMGGVFFWLIANGPNLTMAVINFFRQSAQRDFNGSGPDAVVTGFLTAAALFFSSAALATASGMATAMGSGESIFGVSDIGIALAAIFGPESFIFMAEGLALMLTLGAFAIILQFAIVTIESYLVMSVGTIMIGFAGSRFTFPFSQGYFSYMINVGVKLLVTYIILGVASQAIIPIVITAATACAGIAAAPFAGYGTVIVALAAAAIGACYVVLTVGIIWTIPAFAASLLTGQSQSSGSAILQQATSAFAGAAVMFSQFGGANRALGEKHTNNIDAASAQQGSQAGATGAGSANMAHVPHNDAAFATNGAAARVTGSNDAPRNGWLDTSPGSPGYFPTNGSTGYVPINPATGAPAGSSFSTGQDGSGRGSLASYTPEQISTMSQGPFNDLYRTTRLSDLDHDQIQAIRQNHLDDARAIDKEHAGDAEARAQMGMAYGLSGMSQAAPRDIGQPSAVQVRLSNPDKL